MAGNSDRKHRRKLADLFQREALDRPEWLESLEEFDEPPLFSRADDVAFLADVPARERGPVVLACAVEVLDRVGEVLAQMDAGAGYCIFLTFMDWDLVASEELPVPTPSLFVSPHPERELSRFRVQPPQSPEGLAVCEWLASLVRQDLMVAETVTRENEEPLRIYVGYRDARGFKSVGDFSTEEPQRP